MAKLTYGAETSAPPERVLAAARDFERRTELWPDSHPDFYELNELGDTYAIVTEGSKSPMGSVWERTRYDWSEPGVIKGEVQDGDAFRTGIWELRAKPREGGGSYVEIHNHRQAHGVRGRMIGATLQVSGKPILRRSLRKFLAEVEKSDAERS